MLSIDNSNINLIFFNVIISDDLDYNAPVTQASAAKSPSKRTPTPFSARVSPAERTSPKSTPASANRTAQKSTPQKRAPAALTITPVRAKTPAEVATNLFRSPSPRLSNSNVRTIFNLLKLEIPNSYFFFFLYS